MGCANREFADDAGTSGKRGEILITLLNADSDEDLERLPSKVLDGSLGKLKQLRGHGVSISPSLHAFNPESAERLTGAPVLGTGGADEKLAAEAKRIARKAVGSTAGAAAGVSSRGAGNR